MADIERLQENISRLEDETKRLRGDIESLECAVRDTYCGCSRGGGRERRRTLTDRGFTFD